MKNKKIIPVIIASIALIAILVYIFSSYGKDKSKDTVSPSTAISDTGDSPGEASDAPSRSSDQFILTGLGPPPLDDFLQSAPEKIGTPGVDFSIPKTGEPTDWGDTPVPFINPLGEKGLYRNTSFNNSGDTYTDVSYIEGASEIIRRIYGETWELHFNNENNLTPNYVRWYAKELGATLYDNTDDMVTFLVKDGDNVWWAAALWDDPQQPEASMKVVKQVFLPVGKTITLRPEDMTDGYYFFNTQAGTGEFMTAILEIAGSTNAIAEVNAAQYTQTGMLTREFSYVKSLDAETCRRYALNDIPQSDEPLFWRVHFSTGKHIPDSVTFSLENTGEIHPVTIDGRMGSIRVTGAAGSAKVSTQSAIKKLEHKDGFSYGGIVDGEGRTVFNLPAGYYNIHANLPGGGSGGIRMVPVTGGEMTEITLPEEFKSTYSALETLYGNFSENIGSITITGNKDNGDTAEVSILVNDPLKRDIFPENNDVIITEGGAKGQVTDIRREPALSNVVLVLDTSGSMKNYMQPTVDAARKFVDGLPEGTNIRLLSFAQELTEHKGGDKESVIKSLGTLKANGGTALYDATDKGLGMLKGMEKAYLVVFADGADSRELKNQGKGSDLTREQIIGKINASDITVLTIGFGEGQDPEALIAMSKASEEGAFFSANNETVLDQVFAAVAGKFGNQFVITYNRPAQLTDMKSEEPVVGVMIDDSGSMSAYRDAAITMFHDFFTALPENSLTQFSKFGSAVDMMHITTDKKAVLMQAMGEKGKTESGTEVIKAFNAAVEQLRPLPTNKKVFIFLTDNAMSEIEWKKAEAEEVLARFKEEGIRCLFIGVSGAEQAEKAFQTAATQTGGEYIITSDIDDVVEKLDQLLKKVSVPVNDEKLLPFTIGIKAKTNDGSMMDYFAAKKIAGFSSKTITGKAIEPRAAKITTGGKMVPLFDKKAASLLSGGSQPGGDELKITSHISYETPEVEASENSSAMTGSEAYNKSGKNSLVKMTVRDAYTFDVLSGLKAQEGMQFLALNVDVDFFNASAEQIAYQIPSIIRHFYLSVNNNTIVPASEATWLAAEPLAIPGEFQVTVKKGETRSGMLVFYTQKPEAVTQMAMHFYDTDYGHIQIPLAGKISEHLTQMTELPTSAPARITDAFSMSITGKSDTDKYGTIQHGKDPVKDEITRRQSTILRTLEAKFTSKVQALMKFDPMERFYYGIETEEGPLITKMSNLVYNIPLGFTGETMLAPGSSNAVHMPFELPGAFFDVSSFIYGDVQNSSLFIPVTAGRPAKTSSSGLKFSHEYFDVTVNSLGRSPLNSSQLIVDITVTDKKDGFGTSGLNRVFALEHAKAQGNNDKYIETANTEGYLYGIDPGWAVFDNQTRRGILFFATNGKDEEYTLCSPYFPDMKVKVEDEIYAWPELLAQRQPVKIDKDFQTRMDTAVSAAAARYKANKAEAETQVQTVGLSDEESSGADIAVPAASYYGQRALNSLQGEQDFYQLMYSLKWLPARSQTYYYAPEAVITQGWGTQWDLANLGANALARLGYKATFREVRLTGRGQEALAFLSKVTNIRDKVLPALSYIGSDGEAHTFVIPFMRDISELYGLVYLPTAQNGQKPAAETVTMLITASVEGAPEKKGSAQSTMSDAFSGSFGGGGDNNAEKEIKEITLFSKSLSIPELSLGAMDIGYVSAARSESGGELIKTVVDTTGGLLQGDNALDTGIDRILSVTVSLKCPGESIDRYVHTTILEDGQKLTDICHTLAFNLPEMTPDAVKVLEEVSEAAALKAGNEASDASRMQWFARSTLYRYIAARTAYDSQSALQLGLVLGRVSLPMAVMVTAKTDGTNAYASLDLMNNQNQILEGEPDQINAYRLFSGIFASALEGSAMGDGKGVGLQQIWASLPSGTGLYIISDTEKARTEALSKMEGAFPQVLLSNIQKALDNSSNTIFIVPKAAGKAFDRPRWAWIEIDSKTYDAISVFDTGERSGMASYAMGLSKDRTMQGFVGYFMGVSCASWSISAYSLELENYDQIKEASAALCADILSQLEELLGLTDGPGKHLEGKLKDSIEISDGESSISVGDIENIAKGEVDIPSGFTSGFQLAVKVYFGL